MEPWIEIFGHLVRNLFPSMQSLDLFAVLWTSPHCQHTSILIIKREWWEKHHRRCPSPSWSPSPSSSSSPSWSWLRSPSNIRNVGNPPRPGSHQLESEIGSLPGSRLAYYQRRILSKIMYNIHIFSHSLKNRSIENKQFLYLQFLLILY